MDNPHEPIDPTAEPKPWGGVDQPKEGPRLWVPGGPRRYPTVDPCGWVASGVSVNDTLAAGIEVAAQRHMEKNEIPNGAICVLAQGGRLLYCKALTWCPAFPEWSGEPVARGFPHAGHPFFANTRTQFRIGSVSKLFTAAAILKLCEEGRIAGALIRTIDGDFTAAAIARALATPAGAFLPYLASSTLNSATLEDLLAYKAGICEDPRNTFFVSLTTMLRPGACTPGPALDATIRAALGTTYPISADTKARWIASGCTWSPGAWGTYANGGHIVLGEIVNACHLAGYEAYCRSRIMDPLGMTSTVVADSLLEDRRSNEAPYYVAGAGWDDVRATVLDESGTYVLLPYGGRVNLRQGAAAGGWLTTIEDMARFARDLLHTTAGGVLSPASRAEMVRRRYYWSSARNGGSALTWDILADDSLNKAGDLDGSHANIRWFHGTKTSCFYVFNRNAGSSARFESDLFGLVADSALNVGVGDAFDLL